MPQNGDIVRNKRTGEMGVFQNGQVVPQGGQQGGDRMIAPPNPYKQASEARASEDQELQRQSAERAARNEARAIENESKPKIPAGYRLSQDGQSLEPIPGGPAERGIAGNTIPQAAFEKAEGFVSQYTTLANAMDTFQDDFGGNLLGGLENTAQNYSPIPVGTAGQAEWWAGFKQLDNQIRNDLFGSALTPVEKQAYSATTIEPGMNPEKIKANLARRLGIVEGALERRRDFFIANGYKPEAVDAMFNPLLERQTASQQQDEQEAPPMFREGDGNVAGVTRDNGSSTDVQTLSQSGTDRTDNPALAGVRDEYVRRLGEGESAEQLIKWARGVGIDPSAFGTIGEQVRFRDENPEVPLNQYDTTQLDDKFVQLGGFDSALNDFAQSSVGAGLIAAGDAASGFTLDNIVGATGGNAERARLGMAEVADRNPGASLIGTIGGGTAAALTAEAGLAARGIAAGIPRAIAADSAYGFAAGAGSTDDGSSRLVGGLKGSAAAAVGSYAGSKAGNALAVAARGGGTSNVNTLRDNGINALTVGQTYGNSGRVGSAIRGAEDRLSGIPVVGDMINARRTAGVRQFNTKAFERALEPIGGKLGDVVGEEAIESAQKQVSEAFTTALAGKGAVPDEAFNRDLSKALMGVKSVKRVGDEIFDEVLEILRPYDADDMLSGEALQAISRELRDLKFAYKQDPLFKRAGAQVDRIERAVFDMFDRQASGTVPDYNKAKQAYRRLSVLEDAVMKGQNQTDQMFTAAQLNRSDKANTKKFGGKAAAARGETPFNDLSTAAQDVLPNKVPDSGTAGRLLVPLALVGGGGAADQTGIGNGYGLTIGAILAGLYSKTGQRLLTKPSRGMKPGATRRVLENPRTGRAISAASAGGSAAALTGPQ